MPTAVAAGVLSFQISPKVKTAALSGLGLSIGLFVIFKYALDLGLVPFPKSWMG
jgi:putative tricarboxylic transport membrane protein